MFELTLPLVRKPKHKYGFEESELSLIRDDYCRIRQEVSKMSAFELKEKLADILDRSKV